MSLFDVLSVHLPYCVKRLENKQFIVLNREYKPVGFKTRNHVYYEKYPISVTIKGLTPKKLAKISHDGKVWNDRMVHPDGKVVESLTIYLYDDGCNPVNGVKHMKSYLTRLSILAKCKVGNSVEVWGD